MTTETVQTIESFELGETLEEIALALDHVRTGAMPPAVLLSACQRAIIAHPERIPH